MIQSYHRTCRWKSVHK